jgi:hypothetical protein
MFEITSKGSLIRAMAIALLCAAILSMGLVPRASGSEFDKKTIVTFSAPVEIPGKVLPAGTYVFKLLDSAGNRNIVQIFDKDEKKLYATILAIPDKPIITLEERPSGSPEAIHAWFYPGDNFGQEFVYPHKRAVELAKRTNHNVLSMSDNMARNITAQAKSASDASVQAMEKTEVTGVNPSGQEIELIVVVSPTAVN